MQPHFIVALILSSRPLNRTRTFLRHENDPESVKHYDFYLTPIENADVDSTAPPSRRVRPRAANRLRDCSSEFFEKKTTKKIFHLGVKKTGSLRLKRAQQTLFPSFRPAINRRKRTTSTFSKRAFAPAG